MGLNIITEKSEPADAPWYQKGLSFACTQCGECCTGFPGYTWVSEEEMQQIADYLKIPLEEFVRYFLRKVGDRWSLLELPNSFDCIFLQGKKCNIYPVRPKQCRRFPWWPQNLESPEAWQAAAKRCEGISADAPLVPYETIQSTLEGKEDGRADS